MPVHVQPVLGDLGTYRRFLSDTAGGLIFVVAVMAALPEEWSRHIVLTLVGRPDAPLHQPLELSGAQLAALGAITVVAALVLGPLVNVLSFLIEDTVSLVTCGAFDRFLMRSRLTARWRRRILSDIPDDMALPCEVDRLLQSTKGDLMVMSRHFLMTNAPSIFQAHERYEGMDILCRTTVLALLAVAVLAYAKYGTFGPVSLAGLVGAVVLFYAGIVVAYYRHSRHAAALLALAAMTGDPELLDENGRLPDWFEETPGRWYRRLMQHDPLRPPSGSGPLPAG